MTNSNMENKIYNVRVFYTTYMDYIIDAEDSIEAADIAKGMPINKDQFVVNSQIDGECDVEEIKENLVIERFYDNNKIWVKLTRDSSEEIQWEWERHERHVDGLIFIENEKVIDYDGIDELPKEVILTLKELGYDTQDLAEDIK